MMLWTALRHRGRVISCEGEQITAEVVTIGLDIAKSVFQVHGVDRLAPLSCAGRFVGRIYYRSLQSSPNV